MNRRRQVTKFMLQVCHEFVPLGSWSQCMRKNERVLSMNLTPKSGSKLLALQTLRAGLWSRKFRQAFGVRTACRRFQVQGFKARNFLSVNSLPRGGPGNGGLEN